MNKKRIIIFSFVFACTVIIVVLISLKIGSGYTYTDTTSNTSDTRQDWINKYLKGEGFRVEVNPKYKTNANDRNIVENNAKKLDIIANWYSNLKDQRIENLIPLLAKYNNKLSVKNTLIESTIASGVLNEITTLDTSSGVVFIYTAKTDSVKGIFVSSFNFSRNTSESLAIDEFISTYREVFGNPQISYIDELYNDYGIEFYLDLGIAFTKDSFFLFPALQTTDTTFVKNIGLNYIRQYLGCTYCQY